MRLKARQPKPISPESRPRLSIVGPLSDGLGPDVLALPGEHVLMLRVPIPLATHRQRQAAAGFAIEDMLAEPLEATHVVVGPELGPNEYLVMAVRQTDMAVWGARAKQAGQRLVPDILALPIPASGGCSAREIGGRVLVRRADGTGYASPVAAFEAFWQADGSPRVVSFGGLLPDSIAISATGLLPTAPAAETWRIDLLRGEHARGDSGLQRTIRRLAAVLALALVAHGAVLAADTLALKRIAVDRETTLRAELSRRLPDLPASIPLDIAVHRALPQATGAGGGFLPLMARVSEVLGTFSGDVALRNLAYNDTDGSLSLSIEAPDLGTLQNIESDLGAARLTVSAGVATTGNGAAEARFLISGGGQ